MKNSPQVLIVDDEQQVIDLLSSLLNKNGLKTVSAKTGEQALAKLRAGDSIKLLLLDIYLPDINGSELIPQILKIKPDIKIIMITGGTDIEVAKKCLEIGAHDYIKKPFDMEYLQTSVLAEIIPEL